MPDFLIFILVVAVAFLIKELFGWGNLEWNGFFGSEPDSHIGSSFDDDLLSSGLTDDAFDINPATGLPMAGGIDVGGSPFGVDTHDNFSLGLGDGFSLGVSDVNPATGLPMIGDDVGGLDVGGSPYGVDTHDSFSSGFDDSFGSSGFDSDW